MRTEKINIMNDSLQENQILNNEVFYRNLFDKNPNPMWVYDINTLNFLMVNEAAIFEYGYSKDEFLSMTLKDIRPPEDISILLKNINDSKSTIQDSGTFRHKKKNGEIILVKISSHSINYNGYAARFVMSLDVTEKVTTKQNLVTEVAKLKSIIESTTDAVFSLDKNYCYTSFNSAHSAIMKKIRSVNIEIGRNFLSYIPSVQEKL
jgi:PAS domain S-box-containing protein